MLRFIPLPIAFAFALLPTCTWALKVTPLPLPIADNVAQPSVASDANGGFVVTWQQRLESGASLHFAQLDAAGTIQRQGRIARSQPDQTWFVNWADFPSLVVLDNGDWVTFWLQKRSQGTYAYDIHLTRSVDRGRNWSDSILPHRDATASEHGFVSLVAAGADRVLAIWLDGRNTGAATSGDAHDHDHGQGAGAMTLRSAIIDREGTISDEAEIDARTCDCCSTDAARIGNTTMLIYRDRSMDEIRDMNFSLRDRQGKWSAPHAVHADNWKIGGCPVNGPALAVNDDHALAIWTTMQGDVLSVRSAIGNRNGFGRMIELERGARTLGRVDATPWGKNKFLVSWVSGDSMTSAAETNTPSTETTSIRLNVLDSRLKSVARAIIATLPKGANPGMPRIATSATAAIAVWTESKAGTATSRAVLIRP
ncbi:MAG: hypothetical protein SGI99_09820 [Pseudomonadota bacterium]|nr:hypothetical protein [Pseudomonadota bacterium]